MGLWDFLDKAYTKFEEHAPQIMEQLEKSQERVQKKRETYDREVEKYKEEYFNLSDTELLNELNKIKNDATITSRKARYAAGVALLDERGFVIGSDNKVRRKTTG